MKFLFLIFLSLSFAGCVPFSKEAPKSAVPTVFRWAVAKPPATLQWNRCTDSTCHRFVALSMGGLTRLVFENDHIVTEPELADSWEYSRPNEIIFRIRKDVRWTNGDPLVAADFVRAWKWILEHSPQMTASVPLLFQVQGARAFTEKKAGFSSVGLSAPDHWTLRVRLTHPTPFFHRAVAHPQYWPLKDDTLAADALPKNVLGPFLPTGTLSKPHWTRTSTSALRLPPFHEVDLQIVPKLTTRLEMLDNGETDLVDPLPVEYFGRYQNNVQLIRRKLPKVWILSFDLSKPLLQNREIRMALSQGLRSEEWTRILESPLALARGITFESESSDDFWTSRYAPAKAKSALNATSDLRFTLSHRPARTAEALAHNLAAQWLSNINVRVETSQEPGSDLKLTEINLDLFTPSRALSPLLAAYPPLPPGRGRYKWPDALITKIMTAPDERGLTKAFDAFEEVIYTKDVVALPLVEERELALKGTRIRKLEARPQGEWDFANSALN